MLPCICQIIRHYFKCSVDMLSKKSEIDSIRNERLRVFNKRSRKPVAYLMCRLATVTCTGVVGLRQLDIK